MFGRKNECWGGEGGVRGGRMTGLWDEVKGWRGLVVALAAIMRRRRHRWSVNFRGDKRSKGGCIGKEEERGRKTSQATDPHRKINK